MSHVHDMTPGRWTSAQQARLEAPRGLKTLHKGTNYITTVKPLNKENIGGKIDSAVVSYVMRLSSSLRLGNIVSFAERFTILCPYLEGSTIRGLL